MTEKEIKELEIIQNSIDRIKRKIKKEHYPELIDYGKWNKTIEWLNIVDTDLSEVIEIMK